MDVAVECDSCLELLPRVESTDAEEALCVVLRCLAVIPPHGVEQLVHRGIGLIRGCDDASLTRRDVDLGSFQRAAVVIPVLRSGANIDK